MVALVLALAAALAVPPEPATPSGLTVPFLPQTEALCGGAAAAMVLRYWGERHADVQQFAPLVEMTMVEAPPTRGESAWLTL